MSLSRRYIRHITVILLLAFTIIILTLYWKVAFAPVIVKPSSIRNVTRTYLPATGSLKKVKFIRTSGIFHTSLALTRDEFRRTEQDINRRVENLRKLCKKYRLGKYKWGSNQNSFGLKEPPTPLYSYFFWNREKRMAWCPVYKAGSTSWLQNMMRLAGYSENDIQYPPKQLSIWAREVYGDADNFQKDELEKSLKLLVVRHPFERLLSAYRDKLANSTSGQEHGTHHFYEKYGKKIVQKFRTDPSITQREPTWEEFVRYILKLDLIHYADDHWLPVYYSCTPCLINYTFIAKTETYFRDQKYIIKRAGLEGILQPRWSHPSTMNNESQSGLKLRKKYFGQLSTSQIQQLYEKYKLDFILFGYNLREYLKFGKDFD